MKPLTLEQREVVATIFSGAWHALKSYEYGNTATDLAAEMTKAIEGAARVLGVTIELTSRSLQQEVSHAAKTLSTRGASKGGIARAAVLTPARRKEIAQQAVKTRWAKRKTTPSS